MRQGTTFLVIAALLAGASFWSTPCRADRVSLPDSQLGVRTVPLLLLSRRDVQADLRMTPEQVAEAESAIARLYARASQLRGMKGDEAVAARRAVDEEQHRWLMDRLSESQRTRIVQIDLQWEGASALVSRPSMTDSLSLSPQQLTTLKRLAQESQARRSRGEEAIKAHRWFAGQALELLSDSQRTTWKVMLGAPFQPQLADARGKRP